MKNMPTIGDVYKAINEIAPFSLAEDWDNVGLLIGSKDQQAARVLTALDATDAVIDEAAQWGAQLIVTHHPVIFSPLKAIPADSTVYRLIRQGIGVISAHTNLDIADGGVNDQLARLLGLTDLRPLKVTAEEPCFKVAVTVPPLQAEAVYTAMVGAGAGALGEYSHCAFLVKGEGRFKPLEAANPTIGTAGRLEQLEEVRLEMLVAPDRLDAVVDAMLAAHPYETPAYDIFQNYGCKARSALGRVGTLEQPMTPQALAERVKERLGVGGLKYTPGCGEITTVAVCGGGAAEYIYTAKEQGAQALVTGESKHHLLLEADRLGLTLIDAGHFATETVVLEPFSKKLEALLPGIVARVAASNTDGVRYL